MMRCQSKRCDAYASWIVAWPGVEELTMCTDCKNWAHAVASTLGFGLVSRVLPPDGITCMFCGSPEALRVTKQCGPCWEVTSRIHDFCRTEQGREYVRAALRRGES